MHAELREKVANAIYRSVVHVFEEPVEPNPTDYLPALDAILPLLRDALLSDEVVEVAISALSEREVEWIYRRSADKSAWDVIELSDPDGPIHEDSQRCIAQLASRDDAEDKCEDLNWSHRMGLALSAALDKIGAPNVEC